MRSSNKASKIAVGENHHEDRLDHCPRDPKNRLLVSDVDITPYKEVEELAVGPEFAEVGDRPPSRGADHCRESYLNHDNVPFVISDLAIIENASRNCRFSVMSMSASRVETRAHLFR